MAFRKKIYRSYKRKRYPAGTRTIEELQNDLDEWLKYYNYERTHQEKNCKGMTPMEYFEKNKHFA